MPRLEFQCNEPWITFGARFGLSGKVDRWEWAGTDWSETGPDLSGLDITWIVTSARSVFECYAEIQADSGKPICSRIPNFSDYWKDATGMIRRFSPNNVQITLCAPHESGFESFITGVVTSGLGLSVHTPRITFASNESAPSPSARAFLEDYEPAFFGHYEKIESNFSVFVPYRVLRQDNQVTQETEPPQRNFLYRMLGNQNGSPGR